MIMRAIALGVLVLCWSVCFDLLDGMHLTSATTQLTSWWSPIGSSAEATAHMSGCLHAEPRAMNRHSPCDTQTHIMMVRALCLCLALSLVEFATAENTTTPDPSTPVIDQPKLSTRDGNLMFSVTRDMDVT